MIQPPQLPGTHFEALADSPAVGHASAVSSLTCARPPRRGIPLDEALAGYRLALKRLQLAEMQTALDATDVSELEEAHLQSLVHLSRIKEQCALR
jgi:hypothetical protein